MITKSQVIEWLNAFEGDVPFAVVDASGRPKWFKITGLNHFDLGNQQVPFIMVEPQGPFRSEFDA
jgi:hypothetical protein